jgi:hypothetical protein
VGTCADLQGRRLKDQDATDGHAVRLRSGLQAAHALGRAGTLAFGGTVTGEPGIGLLKRDIVERELGPEVLKVSRGLKELFDPLGILNRGKVLRRDRPCRTRGRRLSRAVDKPLPVPPHDLVHPLHVTADEGFQQGPMVSDVGMAPGSALEQGPLVARRGVP